MPDRIYRNPAGNVDIPQVDLLTLLFETEHCAAQPETVLHLDANDPSNSITKAQVRVLAEQYAHGLRHQYGIGASGPNQDVVVVMSSGQILLAAALYGVIASGGVFSAASHSFTPKELARQVEQGGSRLLVCSEDLSGVAVEAAKLVGLGLDRVLVLGSEKGRWRCQSVQGGRELRSEQRLTWKRITDYEELRKSLIVLLYSSGTTGVPKGVMLSHLNLVAELILTSAQPRAWAAAEAEAGRLTTIPEYRALAHLPVAHIAGLYGYLIAPMFSGGSVYWMQKYKFAELIRHAKQHKITVFYTVPSIYLRIAKSEEVTNHFDTLEVAITGAAPMDADLQRKANRKLGKGMAKIGQTWGLSETTGAVTAQPKGEDDETGSIARVVPGMEVRIVDEEFRDVEPGTPGEIIVRGPLVTQGYFRNSEATKGTFHDGWFCTGDIVVDRGGKFYIVDRKKELLKYKGLQIAPAELENLLITHPRIQEAAIVGLPEEGGSEVPRAYIVADPNKINEDEVKEYVKQNLAPYKQLRGGVRYVDELPKNAIGKILRRELRERAKREVSETRARL